MTEIINGHIYDYPQYYDLVFGSDWRAEFEFLSQCFEKHARRKVHKLFEPACGTGRLLIKFAEAGYNVCGLDLNPKAVTYCNARFERRGFSDRTFVADMTDFRLPRKVDAAFNPINSFRELKTERQARDHLKCMANCLAKGGLYVLGLHLNPTQGPRCEEESWSARRGNLAVLSYMWSADLDEKRRLESVGLTFDVYTPTKHFRIVDELNFRTYTARQMNSLLRSVPELEVVETYDFVYDINQPIQISPDTEDVMFVLRKK